MSGALVDDRSFVSDVVNRDDSVNAFTLNNLLLNDWLSNVMDMMVNILVNFFAEVDNSAFLAAVDFSVLVLSSKTLEKRAVFSGGRVTFVDFGDWNSVGVVNFILDLSVEDRLDVMLNVVDMSVYFSLAFNFFNFNVTVISMNNMVQVLVIMGDIVSSWVELGSDAVVMTSSVIKVRSTSGGSP